MSNQKTVQKGLRENEVERGNFKKPPIPYIPVEDKMGKKVKHDVQSFKVKIDKKTTVNTSVWTEGFLIHVISAVGYIECWVSARTEVYKYSNDLQKGRDAVTALVAKSKKLRKAQGESEEKSKESKEESNKPATTLRPKQKRERKILPLFLLNLLKRRKLQKNWPS